ncbi:MAG: hypothetical protein ACHRXM_26370 [Isosphaerales bacterium]
MGKKRNPPKRLFKHRPVSPLLLAGIKAVTEGDPGLRPALIEAVAAIDDAQFLAAVVRMPAFTRTTLLLAWRDAVYSLQRGDPCDLCRSAPARHIRLLGVGTGNCDWLVTPGPGREQPFIGFPTVCSHCFRLPAAELVGRLVTEHGDAIRQMATAPFRRPAILGLRIGEAGDLGRCPMLDSCTDCNETVWVDADERERMAPETPMVLCRVCGFNRFEAGQLEAVPLFTLGGLS